MYFSKENFFNDFQRPYQVGQQALRQRWHIKHFPGKMLDNKAEKPGGYCPNGRQLVQKWAKKSTDPMHRQPLRNHIVPMKLSDRAVKKKN